MTFYVYIHLKATTDEVFYVGKGAARRAYSIQGRCPYWHNIVNKHGHTILKLEEFEDEQDAFAMERYLIASYRALGVKLVNRTDGGEGASGMVMSSETRAKMSEFRSDPERRKKLSKKLREVMGAPEYRAKLKAKWSDPEHIAKMAAARKKWLSDPEKHAKLIANLKATHIGRVKSPEEVEKLRAAKLGKPAKKWVIDKMAVANKTRTRSPDEIEKRRIAMLGNKNGEKLKGIPKSEATKKKMRQAWARRRETIRMGSQVSVSVSDSQ